MTILITLQTVWYYILTSLCRNKRTRRPDRVIREDWGNTAAQGGTFHLVLVCSRETQTSSLRGKNGGCCKRINFQCELMVYWNECVKTLAKGTETNQIITNSTGNNKYAIINIPVLPRWWEHGLRLWASVIPAASLVAVLWWEHSFALQSCRLISAVGVAHLAKMPSVAVTIEQMMLIRIFMSEMVSINRTNNKDSFVIPARSAQ